jgi:hypothetical protein
MNPYLGMDRTGGSVPGRSFYREEEINAVGADRIFIFLDEHEDTIEDGFFDYQWYALPAWRHSKGALFTFASGAVRLQKWKDPRTRLPVLRKRQYETYHDSVDMQWIRAHTAFPK